MEIDMIIRFTDEQRAHEFTVALLEQYGWTVEVDLAGESEPPLVFLFADSKKEALTLSELAKQFEGEWTDAPDVDSVAHALMGAISNRQIRQIFAFCGLPEAEQRLAFNRAKEMIQEKRARLEQTDRLLHKLRRFDHERMN